MKRFSRSLRHKIKEMLLEGNSTRRIAAELKVSQSTVLRIRKTCNSNLKKNLGGRPKKLSTRDSHRIIKYMITGEASSTSHAAELLQYDTGKSISKWTVQRELHRNKFRAIEKKKKPFLSEKNRKARLDFVKKYESWSEENWKKVIFSDETKISRFTTEGRQWKWKRIDEPVRQSDFIQTVKHGGGNIMLWGCITAYGLGPIHRIVGKMNKEMYLDILRHKLIETVENMPYPINEVIFQQDNDPKHTAKLVKNWLVSQDFQLLQWPAQSPDLNPIENLWSQLKHDILNDYDLPPSSLNELWNRIQEQWDKISPDYCERLIKSMKKRLEAVKKAKGLWTNY